jgi:hypothetical protein
VTISDTAAIIIAADYRASLNGCQTASELR